MKKILKYLFSALLLLIVVLLFNTIRMSSKQVAPEPLEEVTIAQDIYQNLSKGLQYKTISYSEDAVPDSTAFFGFHRFLEGTFPLVHQKMTLEKISTYSLLYTWPGSDPSKKPIILMSHQDVVPVDEPTLGDWEAGPFEGKITETEIIGRGTMDDKGTLIALLEAAEGLLEESFQPERTIFLAFGHDEEVGGPNGAAKIAEYLKAKGVHAAMTLDEGGFLAEDLVPGINTVAVVNLAEKGFASFKLIVETSGGHSSAPPKENTIGILAQAIVDLENNQRPYKLVKPIDYQFEYMGPELPFFQKVAFANPWLLKKPVLEALNAHTTTAPTIIDGGIKNNVIPTVAEATVNFRILPGETIASVQEHIKNTISDKIKVEHVGFLTNPSPVSSIDSDAYKILEKTIRSMFPNSVVVPGLLGGGTDSRYFYDISEDVYRFYPIRLNPNNRTRFHGIDEKISKANYKELVEFSYHLIKQFN
ncbi:M20/M25/M40 family metallo-hydrolase [Maribacter polysiphoniae]|uniref:Carboxypeptidase PM20D1 n=1 Tax=Maribacter polysiphoniae TaxID=429344 RepID=A0A316DTZ0_9FLAO|nr:M20 family peptidase [Maribacter polysiphoniae]MBD1262434.1 M20/M25/M40 family metallo-hydrolase [Maribacter polysiphoniae]PWK21266.1 carboxypeptidase PM20D1 [Maribacter polysiphoniae]